MKTIKIGQPGNRRYQFAHGKEDMGLGTREEMEAPNLPGDNHTEGYEGTVNPYRWGIRRDTEKPGKA